MNERHRHRCMRCGEEFLCQASVGATEANICMANYDVLPRIVLIEPRRVVDHCDEIDGKWVPRPEFVIPEAV